MKSAEMLQMWFAFAELKALTHNLPNTFRGYELKIRPLPFPEHSLYSGRAFLSLSLLAQCEGRSHLLPTIWRRPPLHSSAFRKYSFLDGRAEWPDAGRLQHWEATLPITSFGALK